MSFQETDGLVGRSYRTFGKLVEKRIPIVIETVSDYFPTEPVRFIRGNDVVVFGLRLFRRTVARPC